MSTEHQEPIRDGERITTRWAIELIFAIWLGFNWGTYFSFSRGVQSWMGSAWGIAYVNWLFIRWTHTRRNR